MHPSKQLGISLFELLITLSIVMILLAVALPSEKSLLIRSQDDVMSQQLLHAIDLARNEAVTRDTSVTLCKSDNLKSCGGDDWLQGYIIKTSEEVLTVYQPVTTVGQLHWRSFPNGRQALVFSASGETESENGTFWYCTNAHANAQWSIVVSQSGRARLVLPDANGQVVDSSSKVLSCEG